ncbi:release factor, partial [Aureobasidium melanogenum]
ESSWLLKPFQRSNASTGKPGEHETFLLHIQAGVNALRRAETVLVFSGAKTERDAPSSEADSYRNILVHCFGDSDVVQQAMTDGRILCEDAATDSYQNLLFSLIKYYEVKGKWPRMVTVITHSFKEARFLECHADAICWPSEKIRVQGLNPPFPLSELREVQGLEKETLDLFKADPHGVHAPLSSKRSARQWSANSDQLGNISDLSVKQSLQKLLDCHDGRQVLLDMRQTLWTLSTCLRQLPRPLSLRGIRLQSTAAVADGAISPALLSRARSMAKEHDEITAKLAENFDTKAAKKLGQLSSVTNALKEWEKANDSLSELRTLLSDPKTDKDLVELAEEDLASSQNEFSQASDALKLALVPRHPFADLPCLIEIRPGAGGGEAAIFAGDMLRMYTSYCNRLGLRTSLLKYEDADGQGAGSDAPLQEAVLEVESPGAYGILRCEAGVHRVQRVPATESKGRTHTSAASVLVLPSFPAEPSQELGEDSFDDPNSDYYVDPKDVRTDVMRARGAGGQHVNTTDSAVRLTHLPTGTVVAIQDSRSQPKNREKAWRLLRSRLAQSRREQREEEMLAMRRSVVGVAKMGRENKIRTYNWGQQRVTDHRSGISVHDLDDVLEGGIELERVMESVRGWLSEQEVLGLAAEEELAAKKDS